jgi:hypothetical protein
MAFAQLEAVTSDRQRPGLETQQLRRDLRNDPTHGQGRGPDPSHSNAPPKLSSPAATAKRRSSSLDDERGDADRANARPPRPRINRPHRAIQGVKDCARRRLQTYAMFAPGLIPPGQPRRQGCIRSTFPASSRISSRYEIRGLTAIQRGEAWRLW